VHTAQSFIHAICLWVCVFACTHEPHKEPPAPLLCCMHLSVSRFEIYLKSSRKFSIASSTVSWIVTGSIDVSLVSTWNIASSNATFRVSRR
jgi:hypothetical protein